MPPKAAPASSPNRLVMLSCSGCSAFATPPSSNNPSSASLNTVNFSSPVAEHPLYDFVQPAKLVRQDAHHGDDAGDHAHNRQRPGQQTAEAASNRAIDTPQQTGPAAEYAPGSFPAPEFAIPLTTPPAFPSKPERPCCWNMLP